MKKFVTFFAVLCLFFVGTVTAQVRNPFEASTNNEDEVVHLEQWQRHAAKPGELLVKFHDNSDIKLVFNAQGKALNRFASASKSLRINAVLDSFAIDTIEQLIPDFKMPKTASSKSYGGDDVVVRDLSQWHLIKIENSKLKIGNSGSDELSVNEYELMEVLRELPEVECVEPNYLCFALGEIENSKLKLENQSDATAVANKSHLSTFNTQLKSGVATFNDPLYGQQWGIAACKIDSLLTAPKLDTTWRPIIAIIDTGVDIDHGDLSDNIWTNAAEANGANNQDDDNNGFRDDVHGWDFVNQTGQIHDFNSHGTHCAGIAGAVTNNGIGIAGACPDALIMPVCVMQSDGTGSISTIIQGINYARQNGADVISMSIGTYAYSAALEQALAVAYQSAVLVAAAGNDHKHIQPAICGEIPCSPMFPGAFTFVLGVQATGTTPDMEEGNGMLASFSNIDNDGGPISSSYSEEQLYNYELSAPGVGIMSTVPNGQYRNYNGTSMACPLVSGGIASLLQRRDYATMEILWGDLINHSQAFYPMDFWEVYNADSVAPAVLQCITIEVNDTAYGDSSMYADAGERLQLYPTIRTVWGPADSVEVWLEFQEFEDTNTVHILQNHVAFARPLSSYAHGKSVNPIDIRIDSSVVDGRHIRLTLCAYSTDANDTLRYDFILPVTNGVKLHGMINHNLTLYPCSHYIVTSNLAMPSSDTLFIKPGVTLRIASGVSINAKIIALGKPDSIITFTKQELSSNWGTISGLGVYEYCVFEYMSQVGNALYSIDDVKQLDNCIIRNLMPPVTSFLFRGVVTTTYYYSNNIFDNYYGTGTRWFNDQNMSYHNIINNYSDYSMVGVLTDRDYYWRFSIHHSNVFSNTPFDISVKDVSSLRIYLNDTVYYGSTQENKIREHIYDFDTPGTTTFGWVDLSKRSSRPFKEAHGIVWKVEVNGYDAQDEFDSIIPLGVGTHEFKVYFNRAMDTSITPMVAMGVRPPYTQTAISENAYWSDDSTIYTAHLTLTGRMPIDGLNRIYVSGAQDDEHFEIPYENQRFNVYVASSGSMSAGFQATPGIGKVDLEWNDQEVNYEDFLGFNLYRYQYEDQLTNYHYDSDLGRYVYDTVNRPGDTILLNTSLIQDTVYTDFDVVPGERYYYFYKILSTSLTENSPSKTVSCVPQSSIRGDANGSYNVDIADVITTINYVTGQNPQPFLFDAADVNGDGTINVLDIVGIINIILYGDQGKGSYEQQTAIYTIEDGVLFVNSPVALGGLQFSLANCSRDDIELLEAMNGFEIVYSENGDGSLTLLAYSMSGKQIAAGKTALLRLGDKELSDIVLSDPDGHNVIAIKGGEVGIVDIETLPAQIMKAFPNPFSKEVKIEFLTAQSSGDVKLVFTDMVGREVFETEVATPTAGRYSFIWNAEGMPKGVYFATLYMGDAKAHTVKLVVK